jgi:hypothetical protein
MPSQQRRRRQQQQQQQQQQQPPPPPWAQHSPKRPRLEPPPFFGMLAPPPLERVPGTSPSSPMHQQHPPGSDIYGGGACGSDGGRSGGWTSGGSTACSSVRSSGSSSGGGGGGGGGGSSGVSSSAMALPGVGRKERCRRRVRQLLEQLHGDLGVHWERQQAMAALDASRRQRRRQHKPPVVGQSQGLGQLGQPQKDQQQQQQQQQQQSEGGGLLGCGAFAHEPCHDWRFGGCGGCCGGCVLGRTRERLRAFVASRSAMAGDGRGGAGGGGGVVGGDEVDVAAANALAESARYFPKPAAAWRQERAARSLRAMEHLARNSRGCQVDLSLTQPRREQLWRFSCGCGAEGVCFDDGRLAWECEDCGTWQHAACAVDGEHWAGAPPDAGLGGSVAVRAAVHALLLQGGAAGAGGAMVPASGGAHARAPASVASTRAPPSSSSSSASASASSSSSSSAAAAVAVAMHGQAAGDREEEGEEVEEGEGEFAAGVEVAISRRHGDSPRATGIQNIFWKKS